MFKQLRDIEFFNDKIFAVIGIVLGNPSRYNVLVLKKEKDNLSISKSFVAKDFEKIKGTLKTKVPIILNFSGKGVIDKKILAKGNYLKEILFNGNPEEFYIYTVVQDSHNFASICRKEVINGHIDLFKTAKYKVIDYSIGPYVACLGKAMVKGNILKFDGGELVFANKKLVDHVRKPQESPLIKYKVGSDNLDGNEIVLLSTLLNNLYPSEIIEYDNELLSENQKDQRLKKIFDLCSVGTLAFFLLALLGSYILLGHYNNKYVEYEERLYHFNDNYSQIKKMEEELVNKRFIVENSGILNKNFISFYVNEVTSSVPEGILLGSLKVNPLLKKIKGGDPISFGTNIILIEGETRNSFYLNQWVKKLKTKTWVDKIEIINLNKADRKADSFSLKITIQ